MTERNQGADQTPEEPPFEPGTTGRYVITFDPQATDEALGVLRARFRVVIDEETDLGGRAHPRGRADHGRPRGGRPAGRPAGHPRGKPDRRERPDQTFRGAEREVGAAPPLASQRGTIHHRGLGIVVAGGLSPENVEQLRAAIATVDNPLQAIVPERIYYALQEGSTGEEWGGAQQRPFEAEPLAEGPTAEHLVASGARISPGGVGVFAPFEVFMFTWGLGVTKAAASRLSGRGMKVAVLDTGLDLGHPDFAGRNIVSRSFVANERGEELPVQDGHGHGTHCIGTACGPRAPFRAPGRPPSYGCASNCDIFVGKVLSNQGAGTTAGVIAGIQWAIANGCQVVSMSLGRKIQPDESGFNPAYEQVARLALQRGTLIIAGAGNESVRPGVIHPVSEPANSPSILAVGALDEALLSAPFSNGGFFLPHGAVNIMGPGVKVHSSVPLPQLYGEKHGTSMATPHVAGIAALWAEANRMFRGVALGRQLLFSARRLPLHPRDVGAGLVQAP